MALLTDNKTPTGGKPCLDITHELIIVVLNEGYYDMVMEAARPAGASGGTVMSGKGTGAQQAEKFLGISLANEKDVLLIVASAEKKNAIMQAIMEHAGAQTPAAALCFSLPVTQVVGLRSEDIDNWRFS